MVKKADGGVAGLLGERTGFQVGGASLANYTPQPRPSGLASFDKIHPDFKTGQPMAQLPGITPRPGSLGPVTGGGQPSYGQPGGFANLDSAVQPNMSRPLNFFNVDSMPETLQPALGQPLELSTPDPATHTFGVPNTHWDKRAASGVLPYDLNDPRGTRYSSIEAAYNNAQDSAMEMRRVGGYRDSKTLRALPGEMSFDDYKNNFTFDDGFITKNETQKELTSDPNFFATSNYHDTYRNPESDYYGMSSMTGVGLAKDRHVALPNLNNVFPPPIPSEEQKITDPYQRAEGYKKQPATTPDEVRNKGNPVAQAFGAQPGALNKALGLAHGGIAELLGEPRSGYQGGGAASTNALIRTLYDTAGGFEGTGKTFSEFMDDILFKGDYLNRAQGGRIGLEGGGITDVIETGPTRQQLIIKWLNDRGLPITPENIQKAIMEMSQGGQAPVVTGRQQIEAPPMEMPSPPTGEGYVPEELIGQDISETVTPAVADIIPRSKPDDDVFSDQEMRDMKQKYIDQGGTLDKASWGIEDDVEDAGIMQTRDETIYTDDDKKEWFDQINRLKTYRRGLAPDSYLRLKDDKMKEGINKGFISEEDYLNKWQMPFFGRRGERKTEKIDRYRNWAFGDDNYAQGGRIGFGGGGMTPSERFLTDWYIDGKGPTGSYDNAFDRRMSLKQFLIGPGFDIWDRFGKAKGGRIGYDNGGPVDDEPTKDSFAVKVFQKPYDQLTEVQQIEIDSFFAHFAKAEGGRIGFAEGEGIMSRVGDMVDVRNVPYYGGKALQGLVNSAETLSKFPLAAGKLGSQLIQKPPKKEMFMDAIEDITPGSWSENLGLTSLVEGMGEKRPKDAQTVGGILGLGTEVAVPTGGAFKAGQFLLSKASKAMGKVKDGKTLEKLVDEKLTDSGQSRRDFNIMAVTSGLGIALKSIGLGGLFKAATKVKPSDDVVITLRTFIDDSDEMTEWGPVATGKFGGVLDIESLSKAAQKTMEKLMFPGTKGTPRDRIGWSRYRSGHNEGIFNDIPLHEGSYIADTLKKAGHKVRLEHLDDMGGMGGVDDILNKFKNDPMYKGTKEGAEHYKKFKEKVKKMTEREKFEYHNSITNDYHQHYSEDVEDLLDVLMPVKKAEGGRIGLGAGGPPISGEELKQMKKEVGGSGIMDFLKITGSGGMGSNKNIYDQGQQIPGLDQKQYNYGFNVDANVPFNLPGGGRLEIGGGTGFGRGKTETTYKGEPVPSMSGVGESKLGDQWNINAKITYPFANGGLTKTIPPSKGPVPQGLPSALYNGIMRPRSY